MTEMIICQCGCGREAPALTVKGLPRRFIRYHQTRTPEHNAKIGAANRARGVANTPTKVCGKCKEEFPRSVFTKRKGGRYSVSYCPTCHADYAKSLSKIPISKEHRARINRRTGLRRWYGMTPEQYDALLRSQGGVCKLCHKPPPVTGRRRFLAVDHCHDCGAVRSLLCDSCNRGLGFLRDNPDLVRCAAAYLEAHLKEHSTVEALVA